MTNIFRSRARNTAVTVAAVIGLTLVSVGCSEDNGLEAAAPSASSAPARSLPAHDPEATSGGRTAKEIAEDLHGTSAYRQNKALEELMGMGVDALPARASVLRVAEQAGGPDMSDILADKHRLQALSTLYAMQAPGTVALLREKILDPGYLTQDASYVKLLEAADQVGVDHQTQTRDLLSIVETEPEHAHRLLGLDALAAPVQAELEAALLGGGASAASAQ